MSGCWSFPLCGVMEETGWASLSFYRFLLPAKGRLVPFICCSSCQREKLVFSQIINNAFPGEEVLGCGCSDTDFPLPAFCLELGPAHSSLLIRDVQSWFAFAYSLFLFEKFHWWLLIYWMWTGTFIVGEDPADQTCSGIYLCKLGQRYSFSFIESTLSFAKVDAVILLS